MEREQRSIVWTSQKGGVEGLAQLISLLECVVGRGKGKTLHSGKEGRLSAGNRGERLRKVLERINLFQKEGREEERLCHPLFVQGKEGGQLINIGVMEEVSFFCPREHTDQPRRAMKVPRWSCAVSVSAKEALSKRRRGRLTFKNVRGGGGGVGLWRPAPREKNQQPCQLRRRTLELSYFWGEMPGPRHGPRKSSRPTLQRKEKKIGGT